MHPEPGIVALIDLAAASIFVGLLTIEHLGFVLEDHERWREVLLVCLGIHADLEALP